MPARDDFLRLPEANQDKVMALFKRLAETGKIFNREKFRQLGQKSAGRGAELFEFKSFQDRFIGDFRPGHRFLVAAYANKKKDRLDPADIERAVRAMAENDAHERAR
ncbi:MAG: type II toxin-antitoxin system RelE/ParE family toxin [Candidatus Binataceae bacterium]